MEQGALEAQEKEGKYSRAARQRRRVTAADIHQREKFPLAQGWLYQSLKEGDRRVLRFPNYGYAR